jgi:hypothetical protein
MAALAVSIAGCPGGDDGVASTSGPDDSSTAAPGDATLPDPTAPTTTTPADDSTGGSTMTPPSDSSSDGGSSGSESGEPSTGSESSTGEGVTATPCQGEPLVHVPEITRFAWPATSPTPAAVGDLQDDPDPIAGGVGFIMEPDGGGVQFECDPIAQDCPAGEKCMPWANDGGASWNATRCVAIAADPGAIGDSCTVEGSGVSGIDDCDIGTMCFDVDTETNMGTCIELCSGSIDAPVCNTPGTACVITNDGALTICQAVCNPLATECPPGQGCYLVGELTVCAPDASGDFGVAGDVCEFINACDDGTACLGAATVPDCASGVGCCSPFCTIGDDSTCLEGQTCSPVYPRGQAPLECVADLGLCTLP